MAKGRAYDNLYARLETKEGEKELYRLARQRYRACHVCFKNVDGKYRKGQRELHCIFVDLEKAYNRVSREELWYCMRKSRIVEKYVQLVQDMYEGNETVMRCAVGTTKSFKVKVGLHQGSALSPFLFTVILDRLTD